MPGNPLQQKRRFIRPLIASALVPVFLVGLAVPVPALSFRSGLTTSTDLLDTLEVRPEATVPFEADGFERWIDADADGCDTAREVLIAASHPSMIVVEPPCTVAAGSWHSLYDNSFESDPAQLTVDHTVPLEEAWESGRGPGLPRSGATSPTTSGTRRPPWSPRDPPLTRKRGPRTRPSGARRTRGCTASMQICGSS
jgi:hypothetical protein